MSEDGKKGDLFQRLYADDLVLVAEAMEELEAQIIRWVRALEKKELKVNLDKTKIMECGGGNGVGVLAKIVVYVVTGLGWFV